MSDKCPIEMTFRLGERRHSWLCPTPIRISWCFAQLCCSFETCQASFLISRLFGTYLTSDFLSVRALFCSRRRAFSAIATPAEGRRSLALRQWPIYHPLMQARLRQPSACPWTQRLLTRKTTPFRRNRARDLIFTRDRQRCGDGASPKRPVCHSNSPRPQLPT